MPLSHEDSAKYAQIVDGILAASDLDKVTAKQIRRGLESAVGKDLTEIKSEINTLIGKRFDAFSSRAELPEPSVPRPAPTNGVKAERPTGAANGVAAQSQSPSASASAVSKRSASSAEDSEVIDDAPPKKKVKRPAASLSDADLAARLQAEENARSRPTRGGATRKRAPAKVKTPKKAKKKSSSRVKADDDSDLESGSGEDKPIRRNGAFHKPMALSEPLVALVGGETQLSRPQTVKKIWEYIRAHDLQNPEDKREILCDDMMRAVFKQDKVHMFSMNKLLSKSLYPIEPTE